MVCGRNRSLRPTDLSLTAMQLSPMSASFTPSNDRDFGLPDIGGLSFSLESESGEDKNEGTKVSHRPLNAYEHSRLIVPVHQP